MEAFNHSSQLEPISEEELCCIISDSSQTVLDRENDLKLCSTENTICISSNFNANGSTHFSGIGEDVFMSETASSRACSLKHEGDSYSLKSVFTNDEYSDLTVEPIFESVPATGNCDVSYKWNSFKNNIEKEIASLSDDKLLLKTEWMKEPTICLARILYYLSQKKMQLMQSNTQHPNFTMDKWSDILVAELLHGITSDADKAAESYTAKEKSIDGQEIVKFLTKIDELQHQTACLSGENAHIQEMLIDAGKKLKIASDENLQLKHQLFRTKADLKEMDDLTSEVWSLRNKLAKFELIERKKQMKLKGIEDQKNILFKKVNEIEEKLQQWCSVVEAAQKEIIALKDLVFIQERRIVSAVYERSLTEIDLNELMKIKLDLESSLTELLEANDALRTDKRKLECELSEMQYLIINKEDKGHTINNLECMNSILHKEESARSEIESASRSHDIYLSTVTTHERVNTDLQKSIEIKSGSSLLRKSLSGSDDNAKSFLDEEINLQKKNSASGKSIICHSSDVRDQINEEIRALREQLVRSQVLFTYLLKDGSADHTPKGLDCKSQLRTLLEEGNLSDVIFQCKSFDGQVPARFYNRSNRSSSSYASHRSTPMHCGYTSQSCPTLPIESPVVTKSTQTEPMSGVSFYMRTGTNGVFSATSSNSISKGNVFFSPPSTPCETVCEPLVITDVCEVHREPDDHSFPRHRTNSFLSAVKEGNPKLIDATVECTEKILEFDDDKTDFFESSISKESMNGTKCVLEENKSENVTSEKKSSISKQGNSVKTSGSTKSGDAHILDGKNENNKEKNFKSSQRSMRRGSGAGSPNSQLSIPRYPAFDFGEQEDAQSLFPSPSEPEANCNIKAELLRVMKSSELASDGDLNQNDLKPLKDTSQKKYDTSKSKTLMPELMENSETESAKGSFECEAPDLPLSVDAPPVPMIDIAFPSIPNTFLAKLGVHKDSPLPVEAFDEQELESKFIALSLAFKTDRTTLNKRLELHKRQRDMAEKNVENEFQAMREHLNVLNLKATKSDVRELISKIQNHLDIAQQATARVSGRSETYGAVQQEERVSRAFEVLVLHVDHLKRLFDKEHKELEETKRMLTDTQVFRKDIGENVSEDQKKYLKSFGLPVGSIKSVFNLSSLLSIFRLSFKVGRRRASVAEFQQHSLEDPRRSLNFNQSWTSGFGARKVESRQRTLCPFPTASSVGLSSSSLPTSQVTSISPSRISTTSIGARRCSLPAASPLVPNILQNLEAASSNSNLNIQPLPSPDKLKKKERNLWTRKLSSVSDEREQEDECEYEKDTVLNRNPSKITKHLLMSKKPLLNSEAFCEQFDADDELQEVSDSDDEAKVFDSDISKTFRISSVKKFFNQGMLKCFELRDRYLDKIDVKKFWTLHPKLVILTLLLCIIFFLYICKLMIC